MVYDNIPWQGLKITWEFLSLLKKLNVIDKTSISFARHGYYDEEVLFTIQNFY